MQRYSFSSTLTYTVMRPLFLFFLIPRMILAARTTSTYFYSPGLTFEGCLLITPTHLPSFLRGIIRSVSFLAYPQNTILLWLRTDYLRNSLLAALMLISAVCLISGWRTNSGCSVLKLNFIKLSICLACNKVLAMFLMII